MCVFLLFSLQFHVLTVIAIRIPNRIGKQRSSRCQLAFARHVRNQTLSLNGGVSPCCGQLLRGVLQLSHFEELVGVHMRRRRAPHFVSCSPSFTSRSERLGTRKLRRGIVSHD